MQCDIPQNNDNNLSFDQIDNAIEKYIIKMQPNTALAQPANRQRSHSPSKWARGPDGRWGPRQGGDEDMQKIDIKRFDSANMPSIERVAGGGKPIVVPKFRKSTNINDSPIKKKHEPKNLPSIEKFSSTKPIKIPKVKTLLSKLEQKNEPSIEKIASTYGPKASKSKTLTVSGLNDGFMANEPNKMKVPKAKKTAVVENLLQKQEFVRANSVRTLDSNDAEAASKENPFADVSASKENIEEKPKAEVLKEKNDNEQVAKVVVEKPVESKRDLKAEAKRARKEAKLAKKRAEAEERRRANPPAPGSRKYVPNLFGKPKIFVKPVDNPVNRNAAITIERFVRGWWQRLHFKMALIQHKLDTMEDRTALEIRKIRRRTEVQKVRMSEEVREQKQKTDKRLRQLKSAAKEAYNVVEFLRKENAKLRAKNDKIAKSIKELKSQNYALENASHQGSEMKEELERQAKHIQDTHDKLMVVVPQYEASIKQLKDALEVRKKYANTEKAIRIMYTKLMGTTVEILQEHCTDTRLVEETEQMLFDVSEQVKSQPDLPDQQDYELANDDDDDDDLSTASDDSDNYDDYTLATYEE